MVESRLLGLGLCGVVVDCEEADGVPRAPTLGRKHSSQAKPIIVDVDVDVFEIVVGKERRSKIINVYKRFHWSR